jgi:hypothetical protein
MAKKYSDLRRYTTSVLRASKEHVPFHAAIVAFEFFGVLLIGTMVGHLACSIFSALPFSEQPSPQQAWEQNETASFLKARRPSLALSMLERQVNKSET